MRHTLPAALAAAALLAGCGGDDSTDTSTPATAAPAAATTSIKIADFLFEPDPVTVKAGAKITVTNADSAPHTLTQEGSSPSFDSDTIKGKASGSVTFKTPGTFSYYCQFHPTMKGKVTVVE